MASACIMVVSMMQHYKITIGGKVQGVYFRDSARRVATRLGLAGFARNQPDGSVYIEVEGDEENLKKFLIWCQKGPEEAVVQEVSHTAHQAIGHKGFKVL